VLTGSSPSEFKYTPRTDYGAIENAVTYVDGALYGDDSLGGKQIPVWLTTQGVCVGLPSMDIMNVTRTKYTIPAQGRGAALFQSGSNKLILTSNF
jgi:hypothetical protein